MARGDTIVTAEITIPAVGEAETNASSDVSSILTSLVAIAETQVTPSEIDVDAELDMNSKGTTNQIYVQMVENATKPDGSIYIEAVAGTDELFYMDSTTTAVQLTSGGSLNAAAAGDITGTGYGSGGVALNWNAAGTNFQFKDGAGADDYSIITVGSVELRDSDGDAITLIAPALAADYTMTLPAAASVGVLTMNGSGTVTSSTTIAGNLTWTGTQQFDTTMTIDGATTFSNTVDLADYDDLRYTNKKRLQSSLWSNVTGGSVRSHTAAGQTSIGTSTTNQKTLDGLCVGDVIESVSVDFSHSGGSGTLTLYEDTTSKGTAAVSAAGVAVITPSPALTVVEDTQYHITFVTDGSWIGAVLSSEVETSK